MSKELSIAKNVMENMTRSEGLKIKSIRKKHYTGKIYNISVEKNHNYYVNGVLVKNCHEKSNPHGLHGDIDLGLKIFSDLPNGCEIAIGGGATQKHPEIKRFLRGLKSFNLIPNITVNQFHFQEDFETISSLVFDKYTYGMGVSFIREEPFDGVRNVWKDYDHLVFHLILGIHTLDDLDFILKNAPRRAKVLLLGYKQFGNGINFYQKRSESIDNNIYQWLTKLHTYFRRDDLILSFDNLAIEQLKMRRFFPDSEWARFYQGADGGEDMGSMYVDLVKKEYSYSSKDNRRFFIDGELKSGNMFRNLRDNL